MVQITQMLAPSTLPNVPGQPLNSGPLWITVHETGNPQPGAGALMHARYVNSGGGPARVSFHFAVDAEGAYQILRGDEVGWHASDGCDNRQTDLGCFASVAIETCINDAIGSAGWTRTLENLTDLMAAIIRGDNRIAFGTARGRFSADRIRPHKAWAIDRKHCPERMLNAGLLTVQGTGRIVDLTRAKAGTTTTTTTTTTRPPTPRPVPVPAGDQRINGNVFVAVAKTARVVRAEIPRQWADPQSAPVGPAIAAGLSVSTTHLCVGADGRMWWVLATGARLPVDATVA